MVTALSDVLRLPVLREADLSVAIHTVVEQARKLPKHAKITIESMIGDQPLTFDARLLKQGTDRIAFMLDGREGVLPYKDIQNITEVKEPWYLREVKYIFGI